jgi:hypothetical protein
MQVVTSKEHHPRRAALSPTPVRVTPPVFELCGIRHMPPVPTRFRVLLFSHAVPTQALPDLMNYRRLTGSVIRASTVFYLFSHL